MTNRLLRGLRLPVLCLLLAGPAGAESVYEMRLPGEPQLPYEAHTIALGGATEPRWDAISGLPSNPAQMHSVEGVTFATVLQLRRAMRQLPGQLTWDETRQSFPAFQFIFPLPKGVRLGAGYRNEMRSRGSFREMRTVPGLDHPYGLEYNQTGGLQRFPLTVALPLDPEKLRFGFGVELIRGNLTQEWVYDYEANGSLDSDFSYQDRKVHREADWTGSSLVVGLQFKPFRFLSGSARYETDSYLAGKEIIETAGEADKEEDALNGYLPARLALGLALNLPGDLHLSYLWERNSWSDYRSPIPIPQADSYLYDVDQHGMGLEWIWHKKGRLPEDERRIPLRFGLRLSKLPRSDPYSDGLVRERMVSLGSGFELQGGRSAVDLALYWQELSVVTGEPENRWGFAISFRTSEIWERRSHPY